MIAPIVPIDDTTRVRHVNRSPEFGGPKVVVRYREAQWGDARPRLVSRSYLVTWTEARA